MLLGLSESDQTVFYGLHEMALDGLLTRREAGDLLALGDHVLVSLLLVLFDLLLPLSRRVFGFPGASHLYFELLFQLAPSS